MTKPGDIIKAGWAHYEVVGHPRVTTDADGTLTMHPTLRKIEDND
jgi:hypothetical protein